MSESPSRSQSAPTASSVPHGPSSRTLVERPDVDQYRTQAKELAAAYDAGDPSARARIDAILNDKAAPLALADAQFVLAREHGFANWSAFKERVEALAEPSVAPAELLKRAVQRGDAAALDRMLARRADVRALVNAPLFAFGSRPIGEARAKLDVVDVLLKHGADINLKSDWWAGPWGILDTADDALAEQLITRGATVDVFAAAHLDKLERLRELIDADPSLVDARGGDGCAPLHFARSAEAMDLLLSRGADVERRDLDHCATAVQWALPKPPADRTVPPSRDDGRSFDRVRLLLDRGATPDVFLAAALGERALLTTLLDADPSAVEARVGAPGYAPCPTAPGESLYVYTLGVRKTPAQVAKAFNHNACAALLLERLSSRTRFLTACESGDAAGARAELHGDPTLLSTLSPDDQRALPDAAWHGDAAAVALMLDLGFDPLARGQDSGTALHCAAWQGRAAIVELILSHPATKPRVAELVNTTEPTHGSTPLGWACHGSRHSGRPEDDHARCAKLLLDAGAKPGPNAGDATPAVAAVLSGRA